MTFKLILKFFYLSPFAFIFVNMLLVLIHWKSQLIDSNIFCSRSYVVTDCFDHLVT